jgi:hypothetical protein
VGLWSTKVWQDTQEWLVYYTNGLCTNFIVEYVNGLVVDQGMPIDSANVR